MDVQPPQGAPRRGGASRRIATVVVALWVATIALISVRAASEPEATPPSTAPVTPSGEPLGRDAVRMAAARAIARALAPLPSRQLPEPTPRDQQLFKLAAALKAPGAPVENPCTEWAGPFCARTTLDPFFSALDELHSGNASSRVTIAAFGNSLIASDRIVDIVRDDLARIFGNGGRGLLLIDKLADYGPRARTGISAEGWQIHTVGDLQPSPAPFGLAGIVHVSNTPRAHSRFRLSGETKGTLFWVDKGAGPIELRVDGKPLQQTSPQNDGHAQSTDFTLPGGAASLELIAHKSGTAIQGLVLDRPGPGLVLDTLGVAAADASLFLHADEEMVTAQIRSRAPNLLLIMLGGNEVKRLQWGRSTFEKVERDFHLFIQRVKQGAPGAACLMVGPLDAVLGHDAPHPFQQRAELLEVIDLERKISQEEGCAFFDMYAAMGGKGSLERFNDRGLLHDDLVHPRGQGLDLLGAMLADSLLQSWSETPHAEQPHALAEAWTTLLGSDLLPHLAQPSRKAPPVTLLLGDPRDPLTRGIQHVFSAARAWTVRAPPSTSATAGPVSQRCASIVPLSTTAQSGEPCLPVTLPALPPDLQDPLDRGVTVGAWLLAELVRNDSLVEPRSAP
jgi:lysophospholipase L1-like esterase